MQNIIYYVQRNFTIGHEIHSQGRNDDTATQQNSRAISKFSPAKQFQGLLESAVDQNGKAAENPAEIQNVTYETTYGFYSQDSQITRL